MEALLHLQGDPKSKLTPLVLIHAISGLALPYLALGSLSHGSERLVYGISSPIYQDKDYSLPTTLDVLAQQYITILRREIQPHGPYLLGGWSMGGMIAMRMVALLESQGETVLHVILIDSTNPESIPAFINAQEHGLVTSLTFNYIANNVKSAISGNNSICCINPEEEVIGFPTRPPFGRLDSDVSTEDGSVELEYIDYTSDRRGELMNSIDFEQDAFDGDVFAEDKSWGDDYDDGALSLLDWLTNMRRHISNGLFMISNKHPDCGSRYETSQVCAPVTLIKCARLAKLPSSLSDLRRDIIQRNFRDQRLGWKIQDMQTLMISSTHDHVLETGHAGELTVVIRGILQKIKC